MKQATGIVLAIAILVFMLCVVVVYRYGFDAGEDSVELPPPVIIQAEPEPIIYPDGMRLDSIFMDFRLNVLRIDSSDNNTTCTGEFALHGRTELIAAVKAALEEK